MWQINQLFPEISIVSIWLIMEAKYRFSSENLYWQGSVVSKKMIPIIIGFDPTIYFPNENPDWFFTDRIRQSFLKLYK